MKKAIVFALLICFCLGMLGCTDKNEPVIVKETCTGVELELSKEDFAKIESILENAEETPKFSMFNFIPDFSFYRNGEIIIDYAASNSAFNNIEKGCGGELSAEQASEINSILIKYFGGKKDTIESAKNVTEGMTYEQVCKTVGSEGVYVGYFDVVIYEFRLENSHKIKVWFTQQDGELIVTKAEIQ